MRWDETWRALGPQILDELNQLDKTDRTAWLAEWRGRSLPYTEFVRILWRWAVLPRESESAAYLTDIVDLGLLTENLVRHPMDTGWLIIDRVLADLLEHRSRLMVNPYPTQESRGLEHAWNYRRPDVADWETKLVIEREGLEGLMERVVKDSLQQDIGTSLPSLWRVSTSLASYWAGEESWALVRLASRWQAMEPSLDMGHTRIGWTVEEAHVSRPLDYAVYFRDKFDECLVGPSHAEATTRVRDYFENDQLQNLLQRFAEVSSSLKTADLRWYASQLLLEALCSADGSTLDFLSRHVLGALDVMTLSMAQHSAAEERRLVWSAWGWGVAAFFAAGHRGTLPSNVATLDHPLAVEELWSAIDRGESETAYMMARGLGASVGELWPLLREEASVVGDPIAIRMVAAAELSRRFAPPLAGHRLLPVVVRLLARCRVTASRLV